MDAARADYGVEAARAAYGLTGAGVDVCILDTGCRRQPRAARLEDVVWQDFVGAEATPVDPHGHRTHVASIAVGDGTGGAQAGMFGGVAPRPDSGRVRCSTRPAAVTMRDRRRDRVVRRLAGRRHHLDEPRLPGALLMAQTC